jgi:hypothetical protein
LILILVKCSLYIVIEIIILVKSASYIGSTKSSGLELLFLFLSSKLVNKLYYVLSLFLVYLLECLLLDELGDNKSSNYSSNKSGKLNRPLKVAIINGFNWKWE